MKLKLRFQVAPVLKVTPAFRLIAAGTVAAVLLFAFVISYFNAANVKKAYASGPSETMLTGSFIINMGITPQTSSNGLRPYGMIYDLIKNYKVPIKWSIEPTKVKDGTDFTYNSVDYKGGTFVVPAEYITAAVASRITYWTGQGVNGVYTTSSVSVPVYATITNFPEIMIDTLSGLQSIIISYYTNASIPSSAYSLGAPAGLNQCYDIWTNPHGDPTWATHGYLYNFVVNQKGWVWSQCHCVSMLEDVINPNPPYEQLNFLTQNGLKCWQAGSCGAGISESHVLSPTTPYTYSYPTDPEMQFMGNLELATQAGSERWFQPLSTGGWNAGTKVGVSTANGSAPQQGVLSVFGYAYGNSNYGRVMYDAGHDLTSGGGGAAQPQKVAAQRTYFNFMLLAGKDRELNITTDMPPDTLGYGSAVAVSANAVSGTAPFNYKWTTQRGGSFDDTTAASTVYYPPPSPETFDIIRVIVTDACNRVNFQTARVNLNSSAPLPVTLISFTAAAVPQGIQINWSTSSESNNDYFTLEHSADGVQYSALDNIDGSGNSSEALHYAWHDENPFKGMNYYRLTQTDFDGTQKIFSPISISTDDVPFELSVVNVYPNPFTGDFSITYNAENRGMTRLEIRNAEGKLVYTEPLNSSPGINRYDFSKKVALPKGIYFVILAQGKNKTEARRLVKY
ncbi:MAG TPA: T9SS type A sorting domain-containing protein [Bacteroidia bacterium]|nr:T9SS type A sorting domain-containing protein [Bacteroidia bacterium]